MHLRIFLRKPSVGNLAQLISILQSNMSLAVPPIITHDEVEHRLADRPAGIAEFWQGNGRPDVSYKERGHSGIHLLLEHV